MKQRFLLSGGLGNQMFQYAAYLSLKLSGKDVRLDTSLYNVRSMHNGFELNRVFDIKDKVINRGHPYVDFLRAILKYRKSWCCLEEPGIYTDLAACNKLIIKGDWQSEKYFLQIEKEVRTTYTFNGIDFNNETLAERMLKQNSVSIHVRRGDYYNIPENAKLFANICNEEYYKNAIKIICSKVESPVFYAFSNDVPWLQSFFSNLDMDINYHIITSNKGMDSYKDMYLMSRCRHNIIANSSFSWWGAWLNDNPEKIIIAPKEWNHRDPQTYKNLIPKQWRQI